MLKGIMKRLVFFHLAEFENVFLFSFFEKMAPSYAACLLFILKGKRLSSSSQMFFKTSVFKNFAIFAGKHLCWSLFLIKLQNWGLVFSLKNRLENSCFPTNIARFLKTAFLRNTCSLYFSEILCDDKY